MEIVPSTSPTSTSGGICQVCDQEGHGFHFGAFTCRACAAFFRRCHFSPKGEARCNLFTGKCKPRGGRWFCKKCRLTKCMDLGMTPDNIQYHRDSFSSSLSFTKNRSPLRCLKDRVDVTTTVEATLGIPHIVAFIGRNPDDEMTIPFVEISDLVRKARKILLEETTIERKGRKLSDLEQLTRGLEDHQSLQLEHLSDASLVSRSVQINDWDLNMCAAAKWLMSCERIRNLKYDIKVLMLQSIWHVWGRIERIAMTAKMRVNGLCGRRQFVISHDSLVDYDAMKADISWGSSHSYEELSYFFVPTEVFYDEIIGEVIDVRPNSVEFSFLLLMICLQVAGSCGDKNIEKELDELHDAISNDLHNYYIRQNKTMYSVRLKQLMRIKEHFLVLWQKRREKFQIGGIFNMFRMQFSIPGFFYMYC